MLLGELFERPPVVGFDEFWRAYPRRVGKFDAEKAWNKISPTKELADRIIGAIHWQIYTWEKPYRFVPYPATWLRAGRWNDEMPEHIYIWLQRLANSSHPQHSVVALDVLTRNGLSRDTTLVFEGGLEPMTNERRERLLAIRKQIDRDDYGVR